MKILYRKTPPKHTFRGSIEFKGYPNDRVWYVKVNSCHGPLLCAVREQGGNRKIQSHGKKKMNNNCILTPK